MKKIILGFIIGAVLFSGISVYAATTYLAKDIKYKDTNVEDSLNYLYSTSLKDGVPTLVGHGSISFSSGTTKETKIPSEVDDLEILQIDDNVFKVLKGGYYYITYITGSNNNSKTAPGYNSIVKIYVNETQVGYSEKGWDCYDIGYYIVKLNKDDIIYGTYYGNGGSQTKKSEYSIFYIK